MNVQIIENDGRPEWAVIRYEDYLGILERLEDLNDIRAYDQAKSELAQGTDEVIPTVIFDRLSSGENPLRVWREYRGMTQQTLADAAGVGKSYISQLESGTKTGAVRTPRSLAKVLKLDVDDLEPWPQA